MVTPCCLNSTSVNVYNIHILGNENAIASLDKDRN